MSVFARGAGGLPVFGGGRSPVSARTSSSIRGSLPSSGLLGLFAGGFFGVRGLVLAALLLTDPTLLFLDETGFLTFPYVGTTWAPVGQTPVIKGTGKRFRVNMISAISNQERLRFRLFTGSFTAPVFLDFLGRLLRDCGGRKVHLIVDGHPVHRAKRVSAAEVYKLYG